MPPSHSSPFQGEDQGEGKQSRRPPSPGSPQARRPLPSWERGAHRPPLHQRKKVTPPDPIGIGERGAVAHRLECERGPAAVGVLPVGHPTCRIVSLSNEPVGGNDTNQPATALA